MNENQNVNTKPAESEEEVKQENPAPEKNVIDTKRRIKLQSPITVVHVPKKEKQKTSTEEPAAEDEKPKEKGEKLKKIKRIVTGIGLIGGAALVGIGSYLKGRDDGAEALANDIRDTLGDENQDISPVPDPAGVSETSENSDD